MATTDEIQSTLPHSSVSKKVMTVCFLIENGYVLLGYKKTGLGSGNWNGFGGKVEVGESILTAAIREMKEEAGIEVSNLSPRGKITFKTVGKDKSPEVHIFVATSHKGEPTESEEMRPMWFNTNQVPYNAMWSNDVSWIPQVIAGKSVEGTFLSDENHKLLNKELRFY